MIEKRYSLVPEGSLKGIDPTKITQLQNNRNPERSGEWWKSRISCQRLVHIKAEANGHQRWQPRLTKTLQLKLWTHHVAYATTTENALPNNLGKGASIDHLCGAKGCCNPAHLSLASNHKTNCSRIGCLGVTLLTYKERIIAEYPCPHSTGDTIDEQLNTSCMKLNVLDIPIAAKQELNKLE